MAASFGHGHPSASPIQTGMNLLVKLATFYTLLIDDMELSVCRINGPNGKNDSLMS